jgi:hypothetical protein
MWSLALIGISIRYTSPPIGELRWQKPKPPAVNRTQVTSAENIHQDVPKATPHRCKSSSKMRQRAAVANPQVEDIQFYIIWAWKRGLPVPERLLPPECRESPSSSLDP